MKFFINSRRDFLKQFASLIGVVLVAPTRFPGHNPGGVRIASSRPGFLMNRISVMAPVGLNSSAVVRVHRRVFEFVPNMEWVLDPPVILPKRGIQLIGKPGVTLFISGTEVGCGGFPEVTYWAACLDELSLAICSLDTYELAISEKADRLVVGRPKRIICTFRTGSGCVIGAARGRKPKSATPHRRKRKTRCFVWRNGRSRVNPKVARKCQVIPNWTSKKRLISQGRRVFSPDAR
jgi:hypothetical protein